MKQPLKTILLRKADLVSGNWKYGLCYRIFKMIGGDGLTEEAFHRYCGPGFHLAFITYAGEASAPVAGYISLFYREKFRTYYGRTAVTVAKGNRGTNKFTFGVMVKHAAAFYCLSGFCSYIITLQAVNPIIYAKLCRSGIPFAPKPSAETIDSLKPLPVSEIITIGKQRIEANGGAEPYVVKGNFTVKIDEPTRNKLMNTQCPYIKFFILNIPSFDDGTHAILINLKVSLRNFLAYLLPRIKPF